MGLPRWATHVCLSGEACTAGSSVLLLFIALRCRQVVPLQLCNMRCVSGGCLPGSPRRRTACRVSHLVVCYLGGTGPPSQNNHCISLLACWLLAVWRVRAAFYVCFVTLYCVCLSALPAPACCALNPCQCGALAAHGCALLHPMCGHSAYCRPAHSLLNVTWSMARAPAGVCGSQSRQQPQQLNSIASEAPVAGHLLATAALDGRAGRPVCDPGAGRAC